MVQNSNVEYLNALSLVSFGLYNDNEIPLSWRWMKNGVDTIRHLLPYDEITDFTFSNLFITRLCREVRYTHNQAIKAVLDNMKFPNRYTHQECFEEYKSEFDDQFITPNTIPEPKCRCVYTRYEEQICTPIMIIDCLRKMTEEELYEFVFWCTEIKTPGARPIEWDLKELRTDLIRTTKEGPLIWHKPHVYTCTGIVSYTNATFFPNNTEMIQRYKDYIKEAMKHKIIDWH